MLSTSNGKFLECRHTSWNQMLLLFADALCLDVRYASQPQCSLAHLGLVDRLKPVMRIIFTISLRHVGAGMPGVGPMSLEFVSRVLLSFKGYTHSTNPSVQRILLPDQVLLRCMCYWHEACVDAEPRLGCLGAEVVMRRPRIPYKEIAWLGADFLPVAAFLLEPFHTIVGESIPLWSPSGDSRLVYESLMEFFGKQMATATDDQATIIRAIW